MKEEYENENSPYREAKKMFDAWLTWITDGGGDKDCPVDNMHRSLLFQAFTEGTNRSLRGKRNAIRLKARDLIAKMENFFDTALTDEEIEAIQLAKNAEEELSNIKSQCLDKQANAQTVRTNDHAVVLLDSLRRIITHYELQYLKVVGIRMSRSTWGTLSDFKKRVFRDEENFPIDLENNKLWRVPVLFKKLSEDEKWAYPFPSSQHDQLQGLEFVIEHMHQHPPVVTAKASSDESD